MLEALKTVGALDYRGKVFVFSGCIWVVFAEACFLALVGVRPLAVALWIACLAGNVIREKVFFQHPPA